MTVFEIAGLPYSGQRPSIRINPRTTMISVGVVGYGCWGPNLARCITANESCRLVAISDIVASRLTAAARDYPDAVCRRDWADLIVDPAIDALVIATPADLHFEIAFAALTAGKHTFIEKPIARTEREVRALIDLALRKSLVLMTDHTYVYSPPVRAMRELIAGGRLGAIRRFESVRTNAGPLRHDVGVLWDLAAHDLSVLDFLTNLSPCAVSANSLEGRAISTRADMCVYFPEGLLAHIFVDWLGPAKVRRMEIVGTEKRLVFDDLAPRHKVTLRAGAAGARLDNGETVVSTAGEEPLALVIEDFFSSIRFGKTPLSDGAAGLRVVRLLEAANQSLAAGGNIISLDACCTARAS